MRILLDENMPEAVRTALGRLGHSVDSVDTLRLKGIDNCRLLGAISTSYDLCFTKDRGFARAAKAAGASGGAKVLRVGIPQAPADFERLLRRLRSGMKVAPRKRPGGRGDKDKKRDA